MDYFSRPPKDAAIGINVVDDPAFLESFRNPGCAAAIWRRKTPPHVQDWLNDMDPGFLPKGRMVVSPDDVLDASQKLCDQAGLAPCPERDWLESDITILSEIFTDLMSAKVLELRLDVVRTDACRRFHVDAVPARLICTYRGTGTQFGIALDEREPEQIGTVPTGTPILLRGSAWPGRRPSGLVHRSPPIEGTGEIRLVLALDLVLEDGDYG